MLLGCSSVAGEFGFPFYWRDEFGLTSVGLALRMGAGVSLAYCWKLSRNIWARRLAWWS